MTDFSEFKRVNKFHEAHKEPTCYSCRYFDSIENRFICLLAFTDNVYMETKITTVCRKFSPA